MLLVLTAALWSVFQPSASAHASVTEISPEPDVVLGAPPREIAIRFNEDVSGTGSAIRVFDPSGTQIDGIEPRTERTSLSAELPNLEAVGSYTVSWKVMSADGHLINGAFLFSVGKATLTEPLDVADVAIPLVPKVLKIVGALLSWGGIILGLGLVGSAILRVNRRMLSVAALSVVAGTILSLLGAVLAVDGSVGDSLRVAWGNNSGKAAFAAFGVSLIATIVIVPRLRRGDRFTSGDRRLFIALGLVTAAVIALEGHALGLSPMAASAPLTVLHVCAAIIWLSGLVWIERRSRTVDTAQLRADVAAHSRYALAAVVVLAATGISLFAIRMPIDELTSSAYGIIGSVKIVLLAMAVVLAWQNRSTMTRAEAGIRAESGSEGELGAEVNDVGSLADDSPTDGTASSDGPEIDGSETPEADVRLAREHLDAIDARRFKASLKVEMVVVAIALVAGVFLAQTPPPGLDEAAGGYFSAKVPFGTGKVELTLDPGKRGVNEIHVTALDKDGRLMSGIENLKLSFSLPEKDFGPLEPTLQVITAGHSYTFARIPFGGDWKVTATGTLNRFDELQASFDVPIGG